MAPRDIYSKASLTPASKEIRILVLALGTGDDVLRGDFVIESLYYDGLHYTAPSYTWSGRLETDGILIRGVHLQISKNLKLALHQFRGPVHTKNIWIDAIYINQNGQKEKNQQRALMGDIYSKAIQTWIWLGAATAVSNKSLDYISSLNAGYRDSPECGVSPKRIQHFVQRRWWTRVWLIQEVFLSRRAILQCGAKSVDFTHFAQFFRRLNEQGQSRHPFTDIYARWKVHETELESSGLLLQELLILTIEFKASVRRDKYFALLGVATTAIRPLIAPAYSNTISDIEIATRIAVHLLQTSLRPLLLAAHCKGPGDPSWVADRVSMKKGLNEENKIST